MNSTFTRALIGFLILTLGIVAMASVAIWANIAFVGDKWWIGLVIVIVALASEIGVYTSTLHEPIRDWIKEPKDERERAERERKDLEREARRLEEERRREGRRPDPPMRAS